MKKNATRKLDILDLQMMWVYAFGLFGIGLVLTAQNFFELPGRSLTIAYRLGMLALSVSLVVSVLLKGRSFTTRTYLVPLGGFWLIYASRFVNDAYVQELSLSRPYEEFLFYLFGMCFIPMAAVLLHSSERFLAGALKLSLISLGVSCGMILWLNQDLLQTNFNRLQGEGGLNPITLGHMGLSLVVLCLFLMLSRQPLIRAPKILLSALLGLGLFVMGLASSRGPIAALFVLIPLLMYFALRQGRKVRIMAVVAVAAVCLPLGASLVTDLGSNIEQRLEATFSRVESQTETRVDLWSSAWEDFLDYPLTGRAFEGRYEIYPHNLIIESFMATGIVGGCMFLWLLGYGLRIAIRLIGQRAEYAWLGLLFVQMTIYGLFSAALYNHFSFWYLLAAVLVHGEGPCAVASSSVVQWRGVARSYA